MSATQTILNLYKRILLNTKCKADYSETSPDRWNIQMTAALTSHHDIPQLTLLSLWNKHVQAGVPNVVF